MEASVKLARALEIAGRARVRRHIPAPSDTTAQVARPSERPVALRDSRGRYVLGWAGGPGRPPRDVLRELFVDDLFAVYKRHGREVITRLAEENPAAFLRIMVSLVRKLHKPSDD
jgi:hypothetical protein